MPFDDKDPRANLASVSKTEAALTEEFTGVDYIKFYDIEPDETSSGVKTWYGRGQHFIVAYSEVLAGAVLSRQNQVDEYVLLLPDKDMAAQITASEAPRKVAGYSIVFIPPGDSSIQVLDDSRVVRLFTTQSKDLAAKCSNAASYASADPNVADFKPLPEPQGGFRLRAYSLDAPPQEGRFGRIWSCSTFMVNYLAPANGPRDITKMSPHNHADFEQGSLVLEGEFIHHLRWPWVTNLNSWREDEHELCKAPSLAVYPPPAIHTTQWIGNGINQLVDIFCPPRADFYDKPGWVLNADEYPLSKD